MNRYGVATDYEYSASHKRGRVTIWSGPFCGVYEGDALTLPGNAGYVVTMAVDGSKVRVDCPAPRDESNYQNVDDAISAAVAAWYSANTASLLR